MKLRNNLIIQWGGIDGMFVYAIQIEFLKVSSNLIWRFSGRLSGLIGFKTKPANLGMTMILFPYQYLSVIEYFLLIYISNQGQ